MKEMQFFERKDIKYLFIAFAYITLVFSLIYYFA